MAQNDTTQLTVKGVAGGENHVHTLHFRATTSASTEQGLINTWQASCRTAYRACFKSPDEPVQIITAQQVCGAVPLRAAVEEVEAAGSRAGTLASGSDWSPQYVAVVTSLRTAFAGKSRRGRSYIGGVLDDNQGAGIITAGYKTLIDAYYATLLSTFVGGAVGDVWLWVVHSRKLAAVPGTQCQDSSSAVTTYIVRDQLGTMRSRKIGHGT